MFRGQYDPYFLHKRRGSTLLADEDYFFRLRVAATTTDFNTDVFKKAVQGLVKIWFPQGILDDLGVEIVTQHMHDEEAPEGNVVKTAEIFRSEMFHRVTWMLAEYLDTPVKVEIGIMAIMAASASLHGDKIDENILGTMTASAQKFRERMSEESTERLQDQIDTETITFQSLNCAENGHPGQGAAAAQERALDCTEHSLLSSKRSSNKRVKKNGQAKSADSSTGLAPYMSL